MREFTQAELQIFFDPETINQHPRFNEVENYAIRVFPVKNRGNGKIEEMACRDVVKRLELPVFYVYYMARIQQFYLDILGFPREVFRFKELSEEERAFYNKYHWDIEINLESLGGFREVGGIHYRTDHDLKGHQRVSGESMEVNIEGRKFIPHVLELSFGVDRNLYALLETFYAEEKERTVFRFPGGLSPFDVGVFPLVSKDGLPEKAKEVYTLLKKHGFSVFYDASGSIGRRYRRIDEIGIKAGITIDYQTLQDNTVTLRDRDSMKQIRVRTEDLSDVLRRFLSGERIQRLGEIIN